ncbi:MAG: tetratricopeptide repeat protein, partial [Bacteroidia bacterium]|nr:tetratricopeptide repeat protein [Bacteroidia bacterium]
MRKGFLTIVVLFVSLFALSQLSVVDSLKQILKSAKHDTTHCNVLNLLIENETDDAVWPLYNNQMMKIASENLKTTLSNELHKKYSTYLAAGYNNIGYLAGNEGNLKKGLYAYFNCIKVLNGIHDFPEVSLAFVCIGHLYKVQGEYSKAMEYYKKALNLSTIIKDRKGIANALFFMGDVYDYQGNIAESLECYLKSLKIREELEDQAGTASCFNNIALIYEKQDEYDHALKYHEKSLDINKKLGDKFAIATALNNIGLCYSGNRDLKKAEEFYNKSLQVYLEINDDRGAAFVFVNLGTTYQRQNNLEKALLYFNKSLKIRNGIGQKSGIAQCLVNISHIYILQGKIHDAEKNATDALNISQEIGYPDKIQSAASALCQIYEKQNKGMDAFKMHKLYIVMRDSIKSINSQKALITQNTKYEYEKKAAADSVKVAEEKKVTTAQLKQEKTQRFALYGGILLVGLFGVFMFNRFKITKKQNHLIQLQKAELQKQKELVEEHQKETLDSIHYAKRIQTALIANSDFITQHIPNNFIYFNPKDIVSGDFYWATKHKDKFYLAVCDSTGHGVPGAFMSLLNMGFLSEAIKEKNIEKPNEIFNYVRERLINTISDGGQKDG